MAKVIKSVGYEVLFEKNSFTGLNQFIHQKKYSKIFILCDENTFKFCLPDLLFHCDSLHECELLEIESGEDNKNLSTATNLWKSLTESGADKNSLLINLGGGVISDLGGFIASLFKRGIEFINIPTTLLAMCDASIGGKNAINFEGVKNHIGTITQPAGVFICTKFLKTLEKRQFISGVAEIIKLGLISDKALFESMFKIKKTTKNWDEIIFKSVQIKNKIVKKDPLEKNIRKSLNFGHTIGHALESYSLKTSNHLLHGEAVALGMLLEAQISFTLKMITNLELKQIIHSIRKFFPQDLVKTFNEKVFMDLLQQDKKNTGGNINFTLLHGIGDCTINCKLSHNLVLKVIRGL